MILADCCLTQNKTNFEESEKQDIKLTPMRKSGIWKLHTFLFHNLMLILFHNWLMVQNEFQRFPQKTEFESSDLFHAASLISYHFHYRIWSNQRFANRCFGARPCRVHEPNPQSPSEEAETRKLIVAIQEEETYPYLYSFFLVQWSGLRKGQCSYFANTANVIIFITFIIVVWRSLVSQYF